MSSLSETLRKIILVLFHALILIVPLTWTSATSELFEFPKMLVVYAFAIIIGSLHLARMILERRLIFTRTFLDIPLLIFVISQIISTVFSIDPHTSLYGYYSRFHGGLFSTLAYLVLYGALAANFTRTQAKHLLLTLIVSGVLASLYAFPEHFGYSPSCLAVTGQFNAACWVQDVVTRVFGTFGQPNWLAAYLITIFFIPFAFIANKITSAPKIFDKNVIVSCILYTACYILFFAVLLFTKSRSGLAGLALGFFIFWPLVFFTLRRQLKKVLLIFLSLFLLLISCFLLLGRGAVPQIDAIILKITQPDVTVQSSSINHQPSTGSQLEVGGTESGTIRRIVWQGAFDLWKMHPLFGSGVETFAYAYYQARPAAHNLVSEWDFLYNKAHNEFLNFLSTTGLVGLLAYLALILTFTIWTLKQILFSSLNTKYKILNTSLLSGFWALMVSNFFGFSTVPVGLLFFLFPALAFANIQPSAPSTPGVKAVYTPGVYFSLVVLFLVSCFLLLRVSAMLRADLAYNQAQKFQSVGDLAQAITSLQTAIKLMPGEPLYTDELSLAVAQGAVSLAQSGHQTEAEEFMLQAQTLTDMTVAKNKVHLNYWKTRTRVFIALSALDGRFAALAEQALTQASKLAPTDAKVFYNLASLKYQLGKPEAALPLYQKTLELKPDLNAAAVDLASVSAILATRSAVLDSPQK